MICLAIRGIEDSETQHLSVRLRQTSIVESFHDNATDPPQYCDAMAFLDCEKFDAIRIENCLSKGIHVLLAAATGLSADDISRLGTTAANSGAQFCVANPDRYLPSRQLIREQLGAGHLGVVGLIRSHRWESGVSVAASGRILPPSLIRDMELTAWLFGADPEVVYAVENGSAGPATQEPLRFSEDYRVRRTVQVHLGFSGGGMAIVDYSNGLPSGSGYQMLSVIGSAGVAHADDHRNMQLHFAGGQPRGVSCTERFRGLTSLVQQFVDSLVADTDMSSSIAEWKRMLHLAEAVSRSLDSHDSVSLKER